MAKVGFLRIVKVENFEKFKSVFEGAVDLRKSYGSKGGHLYRNPKDQNQAIIVLEYNSLENAEKYLQSDDLKQKMKEGGAIGTPEDIPIEEVEKVKH